MFFFNSEKIIRLTPVGKDSEIIANNILNGNVQIFPSLEPVVVDKLTDLWTMDFNKSKSTYILYTYALYPVSYLLNAYEKTENIKFLKEALRLSLDFLSWEENTPRSLKKTRNKILFGDHAVSNRTQVLCYLVVCLISSKEDIPQKVIDGLLRNGNYLSNNDNYSHYNHGLMMDLSLLGLLNTFEGINVHYPERFKNNLINRLTISIDRDITLDGVHVENSPGYHFWLLKFFERIKNSLKSIDDLLYRRCIEAYKKTALYADYITRDNNTIPMIGDTHSNLKRKSVKGLGSKFFQDSNIVIFRNKNNDLWMFLSSGYKTHIHKHQDNGALNVYFNGEDIFFDPGFLSYENDDLSLSIKQARAHNTVVPIGKHQNILKKDISNFNDLFPHKNQSNSKIIGFIKKDQYEYSEALISDYDGYSIIRKILLTQDLNVFVYDSLISTPEQCYGVEQIFNIPDNFSLSIMSDEEIKIESDKNKCLIKHINLSKDENTVISIEKMYYSSGFNKKSEAKKIVLKTRSKNILTQIVLGSKELKINGTVVTMGDGSSLDLDALTSVKKIKTKSVKDKSIEKRMKEVLLKYTMESENITYLPHPFKVLRVNPLEINNICVVNEQTRKEKVYKELDIWTFHGGSWPEKSKKKNLHDIGVIESIRMRIYENYNWEDTPIFKNKLASLERNLSVDGCRTYDDLVQLYKKRDVLLVAMMNNGFLDINHNDGVPDIGESLSVSIGPFGEFYLGTGGLHRLAFAQILQLETIPVLVLTRHPDWLEKLRLYHSKQGTKLFLEFMSNHPDVI